MTLEIGCLVSLYKITTAHDMPHTKDAVLRGYEAEGEKIKLVIFNLAAKLNIAHQVTRVS